MTDHPTPWKVQLVGVTAQVIDDNRDTVTNFNPEDADFWHRIVKAVNHHDALVKALNEIALMDPFGKRADDLGRAARVARNVLAVVSAPKETSNG